MNNRGHGPAYREYSRKRYNELKNQLPHLREAELVARIIKEWDAMSSDQKNAFLNLKNDNMVRLNVEPLLTPLKDKMGGNNIKTTGEKKTNKMEEQDSSSLNRDDINIKEFDEMSSSKPMKTKSISKSKSEYLSFFHHYFDKLHKEHPKWNPRQLTHIIKLLWRKRKTTNEGRKIRSMRLTKPVSGRKAFLRMKKEMGLPVMKRMEMWKRLPLESRRQWTSIGNPSLAMRSPLSAVGTMRFSSTMMAKEPMPKMLGFLQMKMM